MSTVAEEGLRRWHALVAEKDAAGLPAAIAEDAVFRSPAVHTPQAGRDLVVAYLTAAFAVLGPTLEYHDEWLREHDAVLRFTSQVDGRDIEGVDMITWNAEGLIESFTVMIRPLSGINAVIPRMVEQLGTLLG